MTVSQESQHLSDAVIAFSLDGRFPEEIANLPPVTGTDLQPAIDNLEQTRQDLEVVANKATGYPTTLANWCYRVKYIGSTKKQRRM